MVFLEVLVYIIRGGGEVLLIEKKRGGLGGGGLHKWSGGGKVEPGEGGSATRR